ncbi:hypothetical protein TIFTF001_034101 [Ficus carica]|uniref:Uncharacterized protein n=1 Tax=Ficus carica TaxID=3494 RepID=A0AA88J4P3_FICCA|nr:hypothetical protein TIFTF001_034101 [Ficus carica]
MRLQQPRFSSKSEPDRAQDPCTARIGATGHMTSVLTGYNSASDTANPNKVSSLAATVDTRWGSMAWRTALKQSKSPLLTIVGEKDEKFNKTAQDMSYEINGARETGNGPPGNICEMVEIPDSGHAVHLENPLPVITALRRFVTRLKPYSSTDGLKQYNIWI